MRAEAGVGMMRPQQGVPGPRELDKAARTLPRAFGGSSASLTSGHRGFWPPYW